MGNIKKQCDDDIRTILCFVGFYCLIGFVNALFRVWFQPHNYIHLAQVELTESFLYNLSPGSPEGHGLELFFIHFSLWPLSFLKLLIKIFFPRLIQQIVRIALSIFN